MTGPFAKSWEAYKHGWTMLRGDKELAWLPFLGLLAYVALVATIGGLSWFLVGMVPAGIATIFVIILALVCHFVGVAFVCLLVTMTVVAAVGERLQGSNPTLLSAGRRAWAKRRKLAQWAALLVSGAALLAGLAKSAGPVGRGLLSFGGIAWDVATVFMVPVLLYENVGIFTALRRSESQARIAFGDTATAVGGTMAITSVQVTVAMFASPMLFAFVPMMIALRFNASENIIVGILVGSVSAWLLLVFTIIGVGAVIQGIHKATLYNRLRSATGLTETRHASM